MNIETYKLKPFRCPNCKHDISIGAIKRAPEEDGLHEVEFISDVTGLPITEKYPTQKDN